MKLCKTDWAFVIKPDGVEMHMPKKETFSEEELLNVFESLLSVTKSIGQMYVSVIRPERKKQRNKARVSRE